MEKVRGLQKSAVRGLRQERFPLFLLLDYFWTDLCRSRENGYRGGGKIILSEIGAVSFLSGPGSIF